MLMWLRLITLISGEVLSECPRCGSPGLRRSQVRFYEKFRKVLSSSRPYRCYGCRMRVWGRLPPQEVPDSVGLAWEQSGVTESLDLDLSALDRPS